MSSKNPWVSIIIPTYNESSNIERILSSIEAQTYKKIETIVVDDGSTDDTANLAKKFARKVYTRKHAERSVQRNFGASKAKGKYLVFLDADMELTPKVVGDCVAKIDAGNYGGLVIPERTTGKGFIATIRKFEREMYQGDLTIEVARVFAKKIFSEFGGYDPKLTGPEDYDLPYRISKRYKIGRSKEFIWHHESSLSLAKLLKKKFYYASHGAHYAQKHPELILRQGILLFRPAYLRSWKKFAKHPLIGLSFLFIRTMETIVAGLGFLKALIVR